jgi:hypothetical protein
LKEGRLRRSNDERYLKKSARPGAKRKRDSAQPQDVKTLRQQVSDLPRQADFRVALHLLDRRGAPSSKVGIALQGISPILQLGNSLSKGGDFRNV